MDVAILASARFEIGPPFAGGLEMQTHVLAEGLVHRGHDVTVYAAGGSGSFRVRPLPVDFMASAPARRDVSAGPAAQLAEHHGYLDAIVQLSTAGHDLTHINAVHHLPFACHRLIPGVVSATLHTPPTPWLESALALADAHGGVPHLVSVSEANAAAWLPMSVAGVIPNGVDLRRWIPGSGGDGVAWWGRLVREKAPHMAIDAARRADTVIRLMGPRHDDAYFAEEIEPRLGEGVIYLGHLDVEEICAVAGRSSVALVTPDWDEPFGLVVAEALACGTPVAAFDRGAIGEVLDEDTGVLVGAGDINGLAAAIGAAAQLDRVACRRRAEEHFSATRMVDAYESWFTELIEDAA